MKPRILATALIAGLFLAPTSSLGESFNVRATNNDTFNPQTREIRTGDKIVWRNPSNDFHTVTAYSNNWSKDSALPEGERTSKRFNQTGTYKYFCEEHGHVTNAGVCHEMCGKVVVRP